MKKNIILFAVLALVCAGCFHISDFTNDGLRKEVEQLKKDVAELQKTVGIQPTEQSDTTSCQISADDETEPKAETKAAPVNNEERAVQAIKYCLRMYKSELKYDKISAVPKSDGTTDVIIDYKYIGGIEHTYYNVSVFKNGDCCVNDISGYPSGYFPHGDKFSVE